MAGARDRLVRPVDEAAAFARRHLGTLGILVDEKAERGSALFDYPRTPGTTLGRGTARIGSFGMPRTAIARGRDLFGSPTTAVRGRGRRSPRNSVLPSGYPRTPLRDITAITTAIERRRSRLAGDQGSLPPQTQGHRGPRLSGAPLEDEAFTPSPAVQKKQHQSTAQNFLLLNDSKEFLTPQKKLLHLIETVKEEVLEELQKLKRTPSCERAEREKKLRVLRSMR